MKYNETIQEKHGERLKLNKVFCPSCKKMQIYAVFMNDIYCEVCLQDIPPLSNYKQVPTNKGALE